MSDKRDKSEQVSNRETERKREDTREQDVKDRVDGEPTAKRRKSAAQAADAKTEPIDGEQAADDMDADAQQGDAANGDETEEGKDAADATGESEAEEGADVRYMRLAADFQNYKKRTEKEKSEIYTYANAKFATDILEVLDNFERAIDRDASEGADEKFLAGMDMIRAQLVNVLNKNGIEEIAAEGEAFDPNFHHAVVMEASSEHESGHVTCVLQKGYKLKDRIIRPAMVKVAE
jgi:molecular chaperone GrpE